MWGRALEAGWSVILENPVFRNTNDYLRTTPAYKADGGIKYYLGDPFERNNLVTLFEGEYLSLEPPGERIVNDILKI